MLNPVFFLSADYLKSLVYCIVPLPILNKFQNLGGMHLEEHMMMSYFIGRSLLHNRNDVIMHIVHLKWSVQQQPACVL